MDGKDCGMMAARRLKGLGWIALAFMVAIACYLVSLQVSLARKQLAGVNGEILAAKRDIRQLDIEFKTRASLRQLERWNGEVLALSAPAAEQFVGSERQLASMDFDARPDLAIASPMELALVSAATHAPAPVIIEPAPRTSIATAIAQAVVPQAHAATLQPKPAKPARDAVLERMAEADKRRAERVAMLEDKLLGDDLVGDLARRARQESRTR
jgi:hypothetical protein